jgi:hypothetical protein
VYNARMLSKPADEHRLKVHDPATVAVMAYAS